MWETIAERAAREEGIPYYDLRTDEDDEELAAIAEVKEAVIAWRGHVTKYFADKENVTFTWEENEDAEYFTDRPGWGGYTALLLAAARPYDQPLPIHLPDVVEDDDDFFEASENWEHSPFAHIIRPELWLPIPDNIVFDMSYMTKESISIGTLQGLMFQLRGLNESRFNMDIRQLESATVAQPADDEPVETQARYALAIFMRATEWALRRRLPLILDY